MPLTRTRFAVAAAFAAQGLLFISLTTRLPDIKRAWHFDELEVSLTLLAVVLLAGAGSVAAERLARNVTSAGLLRGGLIGIAVGMPLAVIAPTLPSYFAGIAVYGFALGVVDATSNMQAVALEHRYGRTILPSFHGAWTFGGLLGALLTLATESLPLEVSGLVGVLALAVACLGFHPREEGGLPVAVDGESSAVQVPWRPIVLVGMGMVVFYMVDTAAQTWGATYLDVVFSVSSELVALATIPYMVASLIIRLAGDGLVERYGAVPVLRVGAVVACAGLVTVTAAPTWPVAVLGFTIVGLGISVVAPLSFSAAAKIAGAGPGKPVDRGRVDVVIARFNQFNYAGALLGAVLTGVVGQNELRFGFVVPMVLVLALLPLARSFAAAAESASGEGTAARPRASEHS